MSPGDQVASQLNGRHIALLGAANSIHLQRWAEGLAAAGWRISVYSQHPCGPWTPPNGVQCHELSWRGGIGYLFNAWRLRRLLARHRPDLLHVHYASGYGVLGTLSGYQPRLVSVWGMDVYEFPARSVFHRSLIRWVLGSAKATASTSRVMAEQVRRIMGKKGLRAIEITPFGVDLQRFAMRPPSARSEVVIGTVKTLAHKYGIDTLIKAFARLQGDANAGPRLRLRIVGAGPQAAQLRQLADSLGLSEHVDWVGAVQHDRVCAELHQLDIYVAVSRDDSESFGVAAIEASACGVPVVVSDAGGLPEVVRDGITGDVVPRDDPTALAAALRRLIDDEPRRERYGAAGRAWVSAEYEWQACVTRMSAWYDSQLRTQQGDKAL